MAWNLMALPRETFAYAVFKLCVISYQKVFTEKERVRYQKKVIISMIADGIIITISEKPLSEMRKEKVSQLTAEFLCAMSLDGCTYKMKQG